MTAPLGWNEQPTNNEKAIEPAEEYTSTSDDGYTRSRDLSLDDKRKSFMTVDSIDIENHAAFKGDDSDGKIAWNAKKLMSAFFLAMLYTGAQIPLYFVGGALNAIAADIGSQTIIAWLPVSTTLAVAAICPFVGYLQDLIGKRHIALSGAVFIIMGCAVLGTANSLAQALAAMVLNGIGTAICELTGIAGLSEVVPVKYRGHAVASLTVFVLPFTPYVMYCELFTTRGPSPTWRWGAWISLVYAAVALIGLAVFYFPSHNNTRVKGLSRSSLLKRIDYVGAILSISGLTLFLVALQAGGYTHPWDSAYVLCTLIIGLFLLVSFGVYEWKLAKYPIVPFQLFQGQRVVALSYAIVFIGGMNFFSLLNLWPLTASNVWSADPVEIGWRGFAFAIGLAVGIIFWTAMLSVWHGGAKWIMFLSATMLAAFGGGLASMTPHNPVQTSVLACFAGVGLGGVMTPAATVAMIAAPDQLITTCAALGLSVRAVGGSIGYSIYYSILTHRLNKILPTLVGTYAVQAGLPMSSVEAFVGTLLTAPSKIASVPGVTPAIVAAGQLGAQWAYANSLHLVWYASISFSVVAMMVSLAVPNTRKFETNRIAVEL